LRRREDDENTLQGTQPLSQRAFRLCFISAKDIRIKSIPDGVNSQFPVWDATLAKAKSQKQIKNQVSSIKNKYKEAELDLFNTEVCGRKTLAAAPRQSKAVWLDSDIRVSA